MAQLNVHLDDDIFFKFKEIETLLKCRTHEKTLKKMISKIHKQLNKHSSTTTS